MNQRKLHDPAWVILWAAILFLIASVSVAHAAADTEQRRSKQISQGLNKLASYKAAVTAFYHQNGQFPSSDSQLSMPAASKLRDDVIASLKVEGEGVISMNFANFPEVANAWIHLVPDMSRSHFLHWRCVSNIADIKKFAPECHFYRVSSESEAKILQHADAARPASAQKTPPQSAASASEKALDCETLKQTIESKLQLKGVKHFQLTILKANDQSRGRIVGQCNRGGNKIEYLK